MPKFREHPLYAEFRGFIQDVYGLECVDYDDEQSFEDWLAVMNN